MFLNINLPLVQNNYFIEDLDIKATSGLLPENVWTFYLWAYVSVVTKRVVCTVESHQNEAIQPEVDKCGQPKTLDWSKYVSKILIMKTNYG